MAISPTSLDWSWKAPLGGFGDDENHPDMGIPILELFIFQKSLSESLYLGINIWEIVIYIEIYIHK